MSAVNPQSPSSTKRRILFVERDFGNVGGSLRAMHCLIRDLDPRYEAWVTFAANRDNPMRVEMEALGCQIVTLSRGATLPEPWEEATGRGPAHILRKLRRVLRTLWRIAFEDARCCLELIAAIRRERIDLVYMNPGLVDYAAIAAIATRVPLICHHRATPRLRAGTRFLTRFVDRSICISKFVRARMEPQSRCAEFRLVYDGVAVPEQQPERKPRPGDRVVACVGRLADWKGQHVLVRAAPQVLREVPDTRFVLAGTSVSEESDAYERHLRELVKEFDLGGAVEFAGHVSDIDRCYREDFDVVVHTSVRGEPFGLVLIEAMAAGLPIVASDSGACREIIEHRRSGLLVKPDDPDALAVSLIELLQNPDLERDLACGGFARVKERFDISEVVRGVTSVLEEILDAQRAA